MICGWHKKAALPSSEQLLLSWTTRLTATIGSFFLQICCRFPFSSSDYLKKNWSIFIFWVSIPVSYTVSFYGYSLSNQIFLALLFLSWTTRLSATIGSFFLQICYRFPSRIYKEGLTERAIILCKLNKSLLER